MGRSDRSGAKPELSFVVLRGPFGFAQGRPLTRRSSTVLPALVVSAGGQFIQLRS
jgi:hypothetical protein